MSAQVWVPRRGADDSKMQIRLPYAKNNWRVVTYYMPKRARRNVVWDRDRKVWVVNRIYFRDVLASLVEEHPEVTVYQDYVPTSKCDTRCREATGDDCDCSCLGEAHAFGGLRRGEFIVGETTIITTGPVTRTKRIYKAPHQAKDAA